MVNVMLGLLAEKSSTQPDVDAVQAPIVIDTSVLLALIVAATVAVQVTPPTQVAPSNITASPDAGIAAPVAPPVVNDHIPVLELSQVHVTVQTANLFTASAADGNANSVSSAAILRKCFMGMLTVPRK